MNKKLGKVILVGAGPGDPELLTVKAWRLLRSAEVVVYDRLVSQEVLDLIPPGTKRIYVGKAPGAHYMDQDAIHALLLHLAKAGREVLRLKGGDPFIFGRGGEEALFLVRHGIEYEVVPGVTAAAAACAGAGIPLTHRGLARGVHLVAGQGRTGPDSDPETDLDWRRLASHRSTLVFYMGVAQAARIQAALLAAGMAVDTPAAVIENGSLPSQRSIVTRLDALARTVTQRAVRPPALLVIGAVVTLAHELAGCAAPARLAADGGQRVGV